jgi:two-component system response regulator AtoC
VFQIEIPPLRQRKEDTPALRDCFPSPAARDFCRTVPALSPETQNFFLEYSWPGNIRELKDAARAIVALGDETLAMGGLRSLMRRVDRTGGEKISLKDAARAASREAEREIILQVLTKMRWNRRRAAQELQISYKALLYKLKQIGYEEYGA